MAPAGGEDAVAVRSLDLEGPAGRRAPGIDLLRADEAVEAVPGARLERDLLAERGVGRLARGDRERAPAAVAHRRVALERRGRAVDAALPRRVGSRELEARIPERMLLPAD